MNKHSLRKHTTLIVFFAVAIVFILVLIYLIVFPGDHGIIKSLTTAAAAAGLVGLFGDFLISFHNKRESQANHRICYVSNDSTFSSRIFNGIREGVKNTGFVLAREYIDNTEHTLQKFLTWPAYNFRGLLIRKKEFTIEEAELMKDYMKDHFIVFVDSEPEPGTIIKVLKDYSNKYLIVNSDLKEGGKCIHDAIKSIIGTYGKDYQVALCLGPDTDPNVKKRCEEIQKLSQSYICTCFDVEHIKPEFFFHKLADSIVEESDGIHNRLLLNKKGAVVVFCGNDHCAYELMRLLYLRNPQNTKIPAFFKKTCGDDYKDLFVLGYDGLLDEDRHDALKISAFDKEFKYLTIDAHPGIQGKVACEYLIRMIHEPNAFDNDKKPAPIKSDVVVSSLWSASVFDMDGTLANTEAFHLKAYQKVLKDSFNVVIGEDEFIQEYMGRKEEEIHRMIQLRYRISYDINSMMDKRLAVFIEEVKDLKPFEEVLNEISHIEGRMYILSSQKLSIIEVLLKQWGLYYFFKDRIISCPEKGITKEDVLSDPLKYFACPVSAISLYEDSYDTIKSAKEKNIHTIGIVNPFNNRIAGGDICKIADRVIHINT